MLNGFQGKIIFILLIGVIAIIGIGYKSTPINQTGVYWGAFDPPTEAHAAIITAALSNIPLKSLIIVVNNHSYKNYTYPLEKRLQLMNDIIQSNDLKNVELYWQDDSQKLDFFSLRKISSGPLCAIAGYDAYKKWVHYSTPQERSLYEAISVIPRGDDDPILFDKNAFLLPISPEYRHVSSTKVRESLQRIQ